MKSRTVFLIFIITLLSVLQGCVRYIPSRSELNRPFGNDPAIEHVGVDAFYQYDSEQRTRLENLISRRIKNAPESWDNAYRIGPSDKLQITVKNFEEISKEYTVLPNGNIQLPFVGPLKVTGLTESQLLARVRKKAEDYVIEPQVHVEVTNYASQKVWILGKNISGSADPKNYQKRAYPLRRQNYSLVELLVEIGDPDMLSNSRVIYLYPSGALHGEGLRTKKELAKARRITTRSTSPFCAEDGGDNCAQIGLATPGDSIAQKYHPNARIQIDVEELFGGISNPPLYVPLNPGDALYIPPPGIVQVYGEVFRRGTQRLAGGSSGDEISASNGIKPSLFSAVSASLGFTYGADIHNVEIFRELEFGKKIVLTVDFEELVLRKTQDIRLRDGDIVWVPSQSGRFIEENSINAINQLIGTGTGLERAAVVRANN